MKQAEEADGNNYYFGDFRFVPTRQLLLHHDVRIRVGSRALDLLHALVRRPGQLVTKDELIRFAWPNTFVQDENLKVNIAALRRALATIASEHSYIATVPGRGYRFVAPLRVLASSDETFVPDSVRRITGDLPATSALIGRDDAIVELAEYLLKTRLLTIVGPAGVGKTSIGVTIARQIGEPLQDGVCFVDLAAIEDPHLVAPAIAFALGVRSNRIDILPGLVESMRGREMLLVLDNCEHVLSAVATIADYLSDALPKFMIVATSREPLRCRRESVYRLAPLLCPGESETAAGSAMSFPAVELLVHRATAQGYRLKEADMQLLAAISRRLDGIPLAIELAAPRLSVKGPAMLLGLLEESFDLLASPADGATSRHTTLMATLDWSYRLLSEHEARLLRHLSVFGGTFALDNVLGVYGHLAAAEHLAVGLESLAARSLLSLSYDAGRRHYRLLDSTRSFASERLRSDGEQPAAMASYSRYLLSLFENAEDEWNWRTREDWTALYGYWGNDLRRAIDWSFGAGQDPQLGVRLTVAGIPLWRELSSFVENRSRIGTALNAIEALPGCDRMLKVKLFAVQGINLCHARELNAAIDILRKGVRLADELGDVEYRARMVGISAGAQFFSGRYREALLSLAELRAIVGVAGPGSASPDIQWHELMIRFCCGDLNYAHDGLTKLAREHGTVVHRSQISRFVIDRFVAIRTFLALAAWTAGEPRKAFETSLEATEAARSLEHTVSSTFVLGLGAIPVAILCGFLDVAQRGVLALSGYIALIQDEIWPPFARYYQATIDAKHQIPGALERMRAAINELVGYNLLVHLPMRLAMHADVALSHDQLDVARASVEQALEHAHRTDEHWCDAELRRLQGMMRWRERDIEGAESRLHEAIRLARQSGALSFELRATTSLAELGVVTGQREAALTQLAAILRRFDNSFLSADVMAARNLVKAHLPTRAQI
jgi:predicted ATPase/DNA-binding winged helix-turn-helix (wHTH) protein